MEGADEKLKILQGDWLSVRVWVQHVDDVLSIDWWADGQAEGRDVIRLLHVNCDLLYWLL